MRTARSLTMEVYLPGGVPARGAYLPRGVYLPGGTCSGTPPPWTEFMTLPTENITLPCPNFAAGGKNISSWYYYYQVSSNMPSQLKDKLYCAMHR